MGGCLLAESYVQERMCDYHHDRIIINSSRSEGSEWACVRVPLLVYNSIWVCKAYEAC